MVEVFQEMIAQGTRTKDQMDTVNSTLHNLYKDDRVLGDPELNTYSLSLPK